MIQRIWHHRLTGKVVYSAPEDQPLGLWREDVGTAWCGEGDEGRGVPDAFLPKVHFEDALVAISKSIELLEVRRWRDWCELLPVDSRLGASLKEKREESALGQAMPHLEEICRNPRSHLKVSEFREPVSRARRVPPRAISLLSAHSEDWHSRTFRSVRPKMVLSEVTEDEWAIYENRALRTLRGRILESFTPRLMALRDLLSAIDRSSDGNVDGYRFRIDRLCLLLDELFSNQQDRDQLKMLVDRLNSFHKALLGIGGTFLLKSIRQSTPVSSPLRATNILRDDKRYRNIYALWHLWERKEEEELSRAERLRRLSSSMDRYTALLCARAFQLLRMVSDGDGDDLSGATFDPGGLPVKLRCGWLFGWNSDGTFALHSPDGKPVLRVAGMAFQVYRLPVEIVGELIGIKEALSHDSPPILLLSLGNAEEEPLAWPSEFSEWREKQRRSLSEMPGLLLVEVSPSSLDAVEHLARVFRRVIAEVEWPELPIKVSIPSGLASVSQSLHSKIGNCFSVAPSVHLQGEVSDLLRRFGESAARLRSELDVLCQRMLHGASGVQKGELAKQKARLQGELRSTESNQEILKKVVKELERVRVILAPAMECPCCGRTTSATPVESMFSCSSDSCMTRWGKRRDGSGALRVFIMPNGEDPSKTQHDPLDRYGTDFI